MSVSIVDDDVVGALLSIERSPTDGDGIDDVVYDALQNLHRYRQFVAAVREYRDATGAFDR